jgi:hypothetical protein
MPNTRKNTKSRRSQPARRRTRQGNNHPAKAYAGERTDTQKYQTTLRIAAAASGGFIEPVNLGLCDQLTTIQATWALWRLESFVARCTPAANEAGAYAICPFEALAGATPVTPTTLPAVLDGGGKLKACTNSAENRSTVRYKRKTTNEAFYTTTVSSSSLGGDPGLSFYLELVGPALVGALFYIEIDMWFSFRQPTEFTTFRNIKELTLAVPSSQNRPSYDVVSDKDLADLMRQTLKITKT